jgi:hypothetical protein
MHLQLHLARQKTSVMIIKLEACILKGLLIKTPVTSRIFANFAITKEHHSIWALNFRSDSQYVTLVLDLRPLTLMNKKFP